MPKYVPIRDQVRNEVNAYLKESGMAHSRFGQLVMADSRFVARLRDPNGQPIKSSTIDKVRVWIATEGKKHAKAAPRPKRKVAVRKRLVVKAPVRKRRRMEKKAA